MMTATAPWGADGAGGAPTEVLPAHQSWWLVVSAAAGIVAAAVGMAGAIARPHVSPPPVVAPPPVTVTTPVTVTAAPQPVTVTAVAPPVTVTAAAPVTTDPVRSPTPALWPVLGPLRPLAGHPGVCVDAHGTPTPEVAADGVTPNC